MQPFREKHLLNTFYSTARLNRHTLTIIYGCQLMVVWLKLVSNRQNEECDDIFTYQKRSGEKGKNEVDYCIH